MKRVLKRGAKLHNTADTAAGHAPRLNGYSPRFVVGDSGIEGFGTRAALGSGLDAVAPSELLLVSAVRGRWGKAWGTVANWSWDAWDLCSFAPPAQVKMKNKLIQNYLSGKQDT